METPILKLRLVLDAGPDEDAFNDVGVDATSLNIDNFDVVDGGCAGAPISANKQQINITSSVGVDTLKLHNNHLHPLNAEMFLM